MILDENPNFPQNSSKICILKILINYIKKIKVHFLFFILLDLFYDCANFKSIGPLVAEIWGGVGPKQPPPPPPPMDSSPQNNPMD